MSARNTKCDDLLRTIWCKNSLLLQFFSCVCLTHGGEELGHLVWIALLTSCEDLEQTFQTQQGQAGALLFPPRVFYDAGDVGVTPHQHAEKKMQRQNSRSNNVVDNKIMNTV